MKPLHTPSSIHPHRPMSLERFSILAEAYGGDVRRWPEVEHAAAHGLAQASSTARARLAEAQALDGVLDLSRVGAPSADVRRRILAQASQTLKVRRRAIGPASARARLLRWLSGLGAIGVLTCGAMAGAAVVAVSGPTHVDADSLTGLYDQASAIDAMGA